VSLVAAVGLFGPLLMAWGNIVAVPATGLAVVALTGATLLMICLVAAARSEAELQRLDRWLLVLGLLTLGAWAARKLQTSGASGTDEAAFVQGAARLLLHGHDPYGANLSSSLAAYGISPAFWTYTTNGGYVAALGYPAFPVLLTASFGGLVGTGQAAAIADLVLLAAACGVMYMALPTALRGLAVIVCVCFPALAGFALAGMTGTVMMVALLAVAYRWRSVGATGRLGRAGVLSAAALGFAASTNQLSWFIAPFLISGIYLQLRDGLGPRTATRLSAAYAGIAAGVFLVINAPFIAWGPGPWLDGVFAPLIQHGLPYGQGLIGLTLFARIGGGAMAFYTYAGGFLYLGLLAVYVRGFRALHRACFIFPVAAFYLSGRSLDLYWMVMVAVIVVAVVTDAAPEIGRRTSTGPGAERTTRRRRVLQAAIFVPAAACLAIALATPAPLRLQILGARSNPATGTVRLLRVAVRNDSGRAIRPHFATNATGQATAFWSIRRGPAVLAPGAAATYVLTVGDVQSMPFNGQPFLLQAVTEAPVTVSSSPAFVQSGPVPESTP
jgi:uncharacterized membrane protein